MVAILVIDTIYERNGCLIFRMDMLCGKDFRIFYPTIHLLCQESPTSNGSHNQTSHFKKDGILVSFPHYSGRYDNFCLWITSTILLDWYVLHSWLFALHSVLAYCLARKPLFSFCIPLFIVINYFLYDSLSWFLSLACMENSLWIYIFRPWHVLQYFKTKRNENIRIEF